MANNLHITDDLLVKYLLGEALPEEENSVKEWIQDNDENARYYNHFKTIWDKSSELSLTIPLDEKAAWQRFKARVENLPIAENENKGLVRSLFIKRAMSVAAVLLIAIATWWVYTRSNTNDIAMVEKITTQQTAIDTLTDGSIITLNKNTKLTYPKTFAGKTRSVTLKGEAFFKVAPDKTKPFIIQANDVTITVVGTAFNVKSYDASTEVIVESGIVKVTKSNETIELVKGEKILLDAQSKMQKENVTDSMYNFYRTRRIVCNSTSLPQLTEWLKTAYNANVSIGDSSLNSLQINTTFDNESLENIITIIQQTFDLKIERRGDEIIFYPAKTD